jgi:hypothetical protein
MTQLAIAAAMGFLLSKVNRDMAYDREGIVVTNSSSIWQAKPWAISSTSVRPFGWRARNSSARSSSSVSFAIAPRSGSLVYFIRPAVGAQDRLVVTVPAGDVERPHRRALGGTAARYAAHSTSETTKSRAAR